MNISKVGLDLIKSFEGCRLYAYKPVPWEKYWTIGWGHYGADVYEGQVITQEYADSLLLTDLQRYVTAVQNAPLGFTPNQNQFDALVSFSYNLGTGIMEGFRDMNAGQVSQEILLYNKSGGVILQGLVRRRNAEKELFDKPFNNKFPLPLKMNKSCMSYDGEMGIFTIGDKLTADAENQWGYCIELNGVRGWIEKDSVKEIGLTDGRYGRKRLEVIYNPCRVWGKEIKPFLDGEMVTARWEMSGYYALDIDGTRAFIKKENLGLRK